MTRTLLPTTHAELRAVRDYIRATDIHLPSLPDIDAFALGQFFISVLDTLEHPTHTQTIPVPQAELEALLSLVDELTDTVVSCYLTDTPITKLAFQTGNRIHDLMEQHT